jgi:hypothetical protein
LVKGAVYGRPEPREIPHVASRCGGLLPGQESPGSRIHSEMGHDPLVVQEFGLNPRASKPLGGDGQPTEAPLGPALPGRVQGLGGGRPK